VIYAATRRLSRVVAVARDRLPSARRIRPRRSASLRYRWRQTLMVYFPLAGTECILGFKVARIATSRKQKGHQSSLARGFVSPDEISETARSDHRLDLGDQRRGVRSIRLRSALCSGPGPVLFTVNSLTGTRHRSGKPAGWLLEVAGGNEPSRVMRAAGAPSEAIEGLRPRGRQGAAASPIQRSDLDLPRGLRRPGEKYANRHS
jgi:hypothetical protein